MTLRTQGGSLAWKAERLGHILCIGLIRPWIRDRQSSEEAEVGWMSAFRRTRNRFGERTCGGFGDTQEGTRDDAVSIGTAGRRKREPARLSSSPLAGLPRGMGNGKREASFLQRRQ
jgi:hypothetical protein